MAGSPQAIMVLGMHRSGTSAVTRVLNLLGAALPSDLLPPVPGDNEVGYWESGALVDLHDELLERLGDSCYGFSLASVPEDVYDRSQDWVERVEDLLRAQLGEYSLWAIKDPRLCKLVPAWKMVLARFDANAHWLNWVRNPKEAASSLEHRGVCSREDGIKCWLRHVLSAERDSRGLKRTFGLYDDLLQDWRGTIDRLLAELAVPGLELTRSRALAIDDFLSPSLRHHALEESDTPMTSGPAAWAMAVYEAILEAVRTGSDPDPRLLEEVDSKLVAETSEGERATGPEAQYGLQDDVE